MPGSTRVVLSVFLVVVFPLGYAMGGCPVGDLNPDCLIDFKDLQALAEEWLNGSDSPANLNEDEYVNIADLSILASNWLVGGPRLVINEVMASNSEVGPDGRGGYADPQGEYDDWIEIYNTQDYPIDIGGMYLAQGLSEPRMWKIPEGFPEQTTIAGHGYLVIWADRDTSDGPLHAGFELRADGEDVELYDKDGRTLIDSFSFGEQTTNISFGRYPDGTDNLRFFGIPTPGRRNDGAFLGEVADTKFSHKRGFYQEGFYVTITTDTPGARIYYSLDGSEPGVVAGRYMTGVRYSGPIYINRTRCLRARALKFGYKPSNIDTQTYIFLDDVIRQSPDGRSPGAGWPPRGYYNGQLMDYGMDPDVVNDPSYAGRIKDALLAIPTISIVTNLSNLFDPARGIYVNARSQGRSWERPVSVELIYPENPQGSGFPDLVKVPDGKGGYRLSLIHI